MLPASFGRTILILFVAWLATAIVLGIVAALCISRSTKSAQPTTLRVIGTISALGSLTMLLLWSVALSK